MVINMGKYLDDLAENRSLFFLAAVAPMSGSVDDDDCLDGESWVGMGETWGNVWHPGERSSSTELPRSELN